MAELKRLVSSRKGYRAHLTKLLQTLTDTLNEAHPFNEDAITTSKHLYEQLERKRELISNLDANILEGISDDSELEAEILQTEEINSLVSNAKAKITQRLKPSASAVASPERTVTHTTPTTVPVLEPSVCLPKLDLLHFAENPLHWQEF